MTDYYTTSETDNLLDDKTDLTDFETYTGTTAPNTYISVVTLDDYMKVTGGTFIDATDFLVKHESTLLDSESQLQISGNGFSMITDHDGDR